ncbi:MAG: helix-turn-helix domain-containing protein [Phocaeicola sp.]
MVAQLLQSSSVTLHVFTDEQLKAYSMNLINEVLEAREPKKVKDVYRTAAEAASQLKTTRQTLNRWEKANLLVPSRVGGRVLYKQSDIDKLMEG